MANLMETILWIKLMKNYYGQFYGKRGPIGQIRGP